MNHKTCTRPRLSIAALALGLTFCAVVLGTLTGCVHHPRHPASYPAPPPDYVETRYLVEDDYVYYPGYQVYYSSRGHQYIYLEGRSWVTRPAPPRVSVEVLVASPSVRLDFHDAPSAHHSKVVQEYPKHWAPPGSNPSHGQANKPHDKGNTQPGHW